MTFVDTLMNWLTTFGTWLFNTIGTLLNFLAYPLGWLVWLIDGIFYLISVLFNVAVAIIKIFVALFQYLGAIVVGLMRTIKNLLFIDFNQTPTNYPSATMTGMSWVIDGVLRPAGFMTVVPLVLIAIIWLVFIIRVMTIIGGGEAKIDA